MAFQYPAFLFALFAIAIPIFIHLFNFQKFKIVQFSNLQFLINIQTKTKRLSQLKRILLLILRILLIIFLVMIFARPIIKNHERDVSVSTNNYMVIYIDNSQSMSGYNEDGITLLDDAKIKAKETIKQFGLNDKFMIITNEFEGGSFRFVSNEDALNVIDEIKIGNYSRNLNDVIKRINNEFFEIKNSSKNISIISDFQKPLSTIDPSIIDKTTKLLLFPLTQKMQSNIYIDSCWFELPLVRSNQQLTLNVNIRNESNDDFEMIPITLKINNEDISSVVTSLKAKESKAAQINYIELKNGIRNGEIRIDDKGPFNFDDVFYFSYDIRNSVNVLELFEKNSSPYLKALFSSDSIVMYTNTNLRNIDYSSLSVYDLIILSDVSEVASGTISELQKYLKSGGVVLIIPSVDADINNLNNFSRSLASVEYSNIDTAKTQISELSSGFFLFNNVFEHIPEVIDLPYISKRFTLKNQENLIPIMKLLDGHTFLGFRKMDAGELYFLTTALNDRCGNFHRHALIVPTLLNMAFFAKKTNELYHTIGTNEDIVLKSQNIQIQEVIKLQHSVTKKEFIPSSQIKANQLHISPNSQDIAVGCYYIMESENTIGAVAFNRNPSESNMSFDDISTIEKFVKENKLTNMQVVDDTKKIHQVITNTIQNGKPLWKYFVILSLFILIIETLVMRFMK